MPAASGLRKVGGAAGEVRPTWSEAMFYFHASLRALERCVGGASGSDRHPR
jgi:hypothetical protein